MKKKYSNEMNEEKLKWESKKKWKIAELKFFDERVFFIWIIIRNYFYNIKL